MGSRRARAWPLSAAAAWGKWASSLPRWCVCVCVCLGVCAFVCERGRGRESERGHVHGFESIPLTCVCVCVCVWYTSTRMRVRMNWKRRDLIRSLNGTKAFPFQLNVRSNGETEFSVSVHGFFHWPHFSEQAQTGTLSVCHWVVQWAADWKWPMPSGPSPRTPSQPPSNEYHLAQLLGGPSERMVHSARLWHASCLLGGPGGSGNHFSQAQQGQSRRRHTPTHSGAHAVYRKGSKPWTVLDRGVVRLYYVSIYVCVCVCMYACVYVCVYLCMYVCT